MIELLLRLPSLAAALAAGAIGGVVGLGSAVILLPICGLSCRWSVISARFAVARLPGPSMRRA